MALTMKQDIFEGFNLGIRYQLLELSLLRLRIPCQYLSSLCSLDFFYSPRRIFGVSSTLKSNAAADRAKS